MFKPDLGAGLSTPVPLTCFCPGIPCVLPEWHENLGCTGPISGSVISQINDFSSYSYYFFFFLSLSGHSFSWLWTPELRGFSICFFKSTRAYGWRKCTKCQRLYFSKCCSGFYGYGHREQRKCKRWSGRRSWNPASLHKAGVYLPPAAME